MEKTNYTNRMKMKKRHCLYTAWAAGLLLAGCSEGKADPPPPAPELSLSPAPTTVIITPGSTYDYEVTTDQDSWYVSSDCEWCTVTPNYADNTFTVEVGDPQKAPAHTAVTVTAGNAEPQTVNFVHLQKFPSIFEMTYPPKDVLKALIIAPSSGWDNYRYQAGAYLMYQMLKDNGVDDDDIMLISEDDIAHHPKNPTPGFIASPTGDRNLYEGVTVDYKPSELSLSDLLDVIGSHSIIATHRLFFYWAGEATPEGPKWLDQTIPASEMVDFLKDLYRNNYYIRAVQIQETDYAGKTGNEMKTKDLSCNLLFSATDEAETSKPGRIDANGHALSSAFTDTVYEQLSSAGNELTVYDFYKETYRHLPVFSNATIYCDAQFFGNLHKTYIEEFIYP